MLRKDDLCPWQLNGLLVKWKISGYRIFKKTEKYLRRRVPHWQVAVWQGCTMNMTFFFSCSFCREESRIFFSLFLEFNNFVNIGISVTAFHFNRILMWPFDLESSSKPRGLTFSIFSSLPFFEMLALHVNIPLVFFLLLNIIFVFQYFIVYFLIFTAYGSQVIILCLSNNFPPP